MKTPKLSRLVFFLILIFIGYSCEKKDDKKETKDPCENPCANPEKCPGMCPNENTNENKLNKNDIKVEGVVEEIDNGYKMEGKLIIASDSSDVVFENADLEVTFNEDGSVDNIEGTSEVPETPWISVPNPLKTDVGFYSGKELNENFNIEIWLIDTVEYFLFYFGVDVEVQLMINEKPFSFNPPLGGQILLVIDFNDPMFFVSIGQELVGTVVKGQSYHAQIPYIPTNPVDDIVGFDAKKVTGGSSSFKKFIKGNGKVSKIAKNVLKGTGVLYENTGPDVHIDWENPEQSDLSLGYRSGFNGILYFAVPGFSFEIGEGSYAIVTEASVQKGVTAKAFYKGIVDPDLSWWPELIPIKPDGQLIIDGYVSLEGDYDFGLSGGYSIEMPNKKQAMKGTIRATNNTLTMEGTVNRNNVIWKARATFGPDKTEYLATPPEGAFSGVSGIVNQKIDSIYDSVIEAVESYKNAVEDYEIELSLRGLRKDIPIIVETALAEIDKRVQEGIDEGIKTGNEQASKYEGQVCSNNISKVVNDIADPYRNVLNRIKNSVDENKDNDQTRKELEAALRDLIALKRVDVTKTVNIKIGNKVVKVGNTVITKACVITLKNVTRNITINMKVISDSQIDLLSEAADNVKYLQEASDIKIQAQQIINKLPSIDEVTALKDNVQNCIGVMLANIGDVGFIKDHETGEYTYFVMINGEKTEVSGFDIFNSDDLIEISMPEFNQCNIDEAMLKGLMR